MVYSNDCVCVEQSIHLCNASTYPCNLPICAGSLYEAQYDYASDEPGDLTFKLGQVIQVTRTDGDWWTGRIDSREGIFPAAFVKLCSRAPAPAAAASTTAVAAAAAAPAAAAAAAAAATVVPAAGVAAALTSAAQQIAAAKAEAEVAIFI